ncbi:hypothetical protein ACJX0J_011340 [Zea mays]
MDKLFFFFFFNNQIIDKLIKLLSLLLGLKILTMLEDMLRPCALQYAHVGIELLENGKRRYLVTKICDFVGVNRFHIEGKFLLKEVNLRIPKEYFFLIHIMEGCLG